MDRAPGQKENRYRTLLLEWDGSWTAPPTPRQPASDELMGRIAALEARIARLESELGLAAVEPNGER